MYIFLSLLQAVAQKIMLSQMWKDTVKKKRENQIVTQP